MGFWWIDEEKHYKCGHYQISKECSGGVPCTHRVANASSVNTYNAKCIADMFCDTNTVIPEHFKEYMSKDYKPVPEKWWKDPNQYYECNNTKISKICIETYPCMHQIYEDDKLYSIDCNDIKKLFIDNKLSVPIHFDCCDEYIDIF